MAGTLPERPGADGQTLAVVGKFALLFMLVFLCSEVLRGIGVVNQFVDSLLVPPAVWLISSLNLELHVYSVGSYLVVPGAKLAVLRGCEALDAFMLLMCAVVLAPLPLPHKLTAVLVGVSILHAINIFRVVVLFYLWRTDAVWFSVFHGYLAPIFLIVCAGLVFYGCLQLSHRRSRLPSVFS